MKEAHPKIHIIVNCANRKRVTPKAELSSIPQNALEERVVAWWEKLNNTSDLSPQNGNLFLKNDGKVKANNLYVGSYWAIIRSLPEVAEMSGFNSSLWIISAGYGLISSDDQIHSYSATFASGNENSVVSGEYNAINRNQFLKQWWEQISNFPLQNNSNPRKISQLLQNHASDYFLIVSSADYLTAVAEDLSKGIDNLTSPNSILIITSKSFSDERLQNNIIPADARLQCHSNCAEKCEKHLVPLGVRGTIGASLAFAIIKKTQEVGFNAQVIKQFVEKRIKETPDIVSFDRTRLDDDEIRKFISQELKASPSASCTFLLRRMRNEGWACEQKRFKSIYWAVKGSAK